MSKNMVICCVLVEKITSQYFARLSPVYHLTNLTNLSFMCEISCNINVKCRASRHIITPTVPAQLSVLTSHTNECKPPYFARTTWAQQGYIRTKGVAECGNCTNTHNFFFSLRPDPCFSLFLFFYLQVNLDFKHLFLLLEFFELVENTKSVLI